MKRIALTLMAVVVVMASFAQRRSMRSPLIVKTEAGLVKGVKERGVMSFYGIPYARAERFMPPVKTEKWDTVMVCDHYGPISYQASQPDSRYVIPMSEDCQVLNVWTKDTQAKKKPVMLWIHGGGYGAGTTTWNPCIGLATKDVVAVSLHHRLNILGFLDLSACGGKYQQTGNQSMLDIVAALQWIHDNISAFGGDPDNVTIMGQSGGGGKVATLLCMPAAKDLFKRAIIMSGAFASDNSRELSQKLGLEVLHQLGIAPADVDKIRDVPYDELAAAGQRATEVIASQAADPAAARFAAFSPTPDGEVVAQNPYTPSFPSFSSKKPIIMGTVISEGEPYPGNITMDEAKTMLKERLGADAERFIKLFKAAWPDSRPGDILAVDGGMRYSTIEAADKITKVHKAPVYCYLFNCKSKKTNVAAHGNDVDFAFFNIGDDPDGDFSTKNADELHVSDVMSQAWVNFAYTGNPNVKGEPTWKPYMAEGGDCFIFQSKSEIKHNFDREYQEILHCHPAQRPHREAAARPILKTHIETGDIEGELDGNDVAIYKAIPYAAPPVGDLRWKAPQPAKSWKGVYKAKDYGSWPPQPTLPDSSNFRMSEDCLYLGISTPATSTDDKLPVMVWIHGGGWRTHGYANDLFTPLARHGVVVVSIEYRTGALGFLAHPELTKEGDGHSGNYGILDQIYALKWVQRNIKAFGGDPSKVLVFGESAGAMSTSILCASPEAKGLFRAAISQSGGWFGPNDRTQAEAEKHGVEFQKYLGAKSIAEMRKMDAFALTGDDCDFAGFSPCIDGYVITDDLYKNYETGRYNDVPVIVMVNSDEGAMFSRPVTLKEYKESLRRDYGKYAKEMLRLYPASNDQEAVVANNAIMREKIFGWGTYAWARLQMKTGKAPVWAAFLAQPSTISCIGDRPRNGVSHADDILYINGEMHNAQRREGNHEHESAISEMMQRYWTNFAKTLNPNAPGLPYWPAFNADEETVMQFYKGASLVGVPHKAQLDQFEKMNSKIIRNRKIR